MKRDNLYQLIELKKERDEFLKTWIIGGFFGYHKFKYGSKKSGFLYAFFSLLMTGLLISSLYLFIENKIMGLPFTNNYVLIMFLAGLFIHILVLIFLIIDLFKKINELDKKIKEVQEEK